MEPGPRGLTVGMGGGGAGKWGIFSAYTLITTAGLVAASGHPGRPSPEYLVVVSI